MVNCRLPSSCHGGGSSSFTSLSALVLGPSFYSSHHCGLNYLPRKDMFNSNPQDPWMWSYLEKGSLQIQSSQVTQGLGRALSPMTGVHIRKPCEGPDTGGRPGDSGAELGWYSYKLRFTRMASSSRSWKRRGRMPFGPPKLGEKDLKDLKATPSMVICEAALRNCRGLCNRCAVSAPCGLSHISQGIRITNIFSSAYLLSSLVKYLYIWCTDGKVSSISHWIALLFF